MPKKKEKVATKETKPVIEGPTFRDLDEIWNVVEEMQKNINFVNDKLQRVCSRLGI